MIFSRPGLPLTWLWFMIGYTRHWTRDKETGSEAHYYKMQLPGCGATMNIIGGQLPIVATGVGSVIPE